jgi:ADP-ribose pyrophosphatase
MHRNGPWTVEASEEKYRNDFLRLVEDAVVRPDGQRGRYATVEIKPGISVLPVDGDGRVRLVRQFRYSIGRESLEVVSGAIDRGEDALAAARRELAEELGLRASRWTDMGPMEVETSIVRCHVRLFLCRELEIGTPRREATEQMQPEAMTLAEAAEAVATGRIVHGASCVLILKAERLLSRAGVAAP